MNAQHSGSSTHAMPPDRDLLDAIASTQSLFIRNSTNRSVFEHLLENLLAITRSDYGFIGEVQTDDDGAPFLHTHAITNIAWNEATRELYKQFERGGLQFRNLKTLFGHAMTTRQVVISNEPGSDPRRGGLPPGHPSMNCFLGIPVFAGSEMVGLVGLANREGGYDQSLVDFLAPLLSTCGHIIEAVQNDLARRAALAQAQETRSRFQALFDTMIDGVMTVDENGKIQSINASAERMFGYRAEELLDLPCTVLLANQQAHASGESWIDQCLQQHPGVHTSSAAIDMRRSDGSALAAEVSMSETRLDDERLFSVVIRDVTERRRHERDLRLTTTMQTALLAAAPFAIIAMDDKGTIQTFNSAAESLTGYSPEQVIGKRQLSSLFAPEELRQFANKLAVQLDRDTPADDEALRLCADNDLQPQQEWSWVGANGRRVPILLSLSRLPAADDDPSVYIAMVLDLTQRRATEQRLRDSEMRKTAMSETALDCIVGIDEDGLIVEFNPAAERTFGISFEAARGKDMVELIIPPRYRDAHRRGMQHYRQTGQGAVIGKRIEISAIRASGEEFPVELAVAVSQVDTRPFFIAYLRDISAQKAAQDEIKRAAQEFNSVLQLSPDGFVLFNRDGACSFVNPAFETMTGLRADAILGHSTREFDEQLRRATEPVPAWRPLQEKNDVESEVLSFSRPRPLVVKYAIRLLLSSDGYQLGQVLHLRDITHETAVDRMKSEFLSTAAHELRTPMASIHGFSELLLDREFDAETQRDLLDTIHRQSSNLVNLVNELLDLARIEARGGKDFNIRPQPLQPIVESVVAGFRPPEGDYQFEIDMDKRPWQVAADSEKLGQALLNVLSNAYKYSPGGGIVRVSLIRQTDPRPELGICVSDQGIGIAPSQQQRVFERFFRADTSGAIAGTGLGLSLVKEIIELHQGRVSLQSAPDKGTTVTLWLPEVTDDASPLATNPP